MRRGFRSYLIGGSVLLMLAGCGKGVMQFGSGERESWRHQAEAQCMQSGAVKESATVVRVSPIEGPGICGADFPLKVASLGESSVLGYGDELRPPGGILGAQMPRWPVAEPRYS